MRQTTTDKIIAELQAEIDARQLAIVKLKVVQSQERSKKLVKPRPVPAKESA
jgi:RNA-binding protein YhbY